MLGIKRIALLSIVMFTVMSSFADITATSQNLEDFSFKKGFKANGGLSFSNDFYAGSDSLVKRDPYAFYLNGNLNMNLWGISMPFSFSLSNTQRSYTQPFNRFKLDPRYKWVHLLLGTNVMSLGKYTLSDHDFNGVGVELTPGNWEISGMFGRLNKAVEYDPLKDNAGFVCYKRMGYAGKVGYHGKTGSYEVTFFHGEDKENSLKEYVPSECFIAPRKNTAISAAVTQTFLTYFNVHVEYALSVYNGNLLNDQLDTVVTTTFINKIFRKKESERMADAFNASVGYQGKVWGLSLQYERISPYYSSLGGYYFNEDEQNITIAPNVKLLKGRLFMSGNFGLQFNNLNNDRSTDTRHIVYSANISYNTGKVWTTSLNFSNFNTYTRVKPISYPYYTNALDSLNYYQVSRCVSLMNAFNFGKDKDVKEMLSLTTSYQCANMLTEDELTSFSDFYNGSLNFSQQFEKSALGWSAYFNVNYCKATMTNTLYFGPGAALNKSFFEGKLSTGLSVSYNSNVVKDRENGGLINSGLNASYAIKPENKKAPTHSFSFHSGFTKYMGAMVTGNNKFESLTNLTYRINF